MTQPIDPKRERIVKAAVEWVYDQSCSHALTELEDAVTDFIGQPLDAQPRAAGEEQPADLFIHSSPRADACQHDWSGEQDILDEDGRPCGSTTVCSRCGVSAFEHSLRYGE